MTVKLSFCIPTYNRAAFLGQTLDSIIAQATNEIEIVISDNASTDSTYELVQKYQARFPYITYFRQPKNLGFDRNMLKAVELARADYCWLMGSDDAVVEGAIPTVLGLPLKSDIYLFDRINMSYDFSTTIGPQSMLSAPPGTLYMCHSKNELRHFISNAKSIGGLFSYISALMVKRSSWEAAGPVEQSIGSGYVHVAKLLSVSYRGGTIHYVGKPLVRNRRGNDELQRTVGYTQRRLTDFQYYEIAERSFGSDAELLEEISNVLAGQFFTLRVMLSDKRSSLLQDGMAGALQLKDAYSKIFSRRSDYFFKMAIWRMMNLTLLNVIRAWGGVSKA